MECTVALTKLSIGAFCGMLVLGCGSPTETSAIGIALSEQAFAIGQGASKTITVTVLAIRWISQDRPHTSLVRIR